jgi:hypothetical protein
MARVEYGRHKKTNNAADDGISEVQPSHWNEDHSQVGVLGFDEPSETLIVSGVVTPVNTPSVIIIGAESGTIDVVDTIVSTDYAINDVIQVKSTTGDGITLTNSDNISFNTGLFVQLGNVNQLYLRWNGSKWKELIQRQRMFADNVNRTVNYI